MKRKKKGVSHWVRGKGKEKGTAAFQVKQPDKTRRWWEKTSDSRNQ